MTKEEKRVFMLKKKIRSFFDEAFDNILELENFNFILYVNNYDEMIINDSDLVINNKHLDDYGDNNLLIYSTKLYEIIGEIPESEKEDIITIENIRKRVNDKYDLSISKNPETRIVDLYVNNIFRNFCFDEFIEEFSSIFPSKFTDYVSVTVYRNGETSFYVEKNRNFNGEF